MHAFNPTYKSPVKRWRAWRMPLIDFVPSTKLHLFLSFLLTLSELEVEYSAMQTYIYDVVRVSTSGHWPSVTQPPVPNYAFQSSWGYFTCT